MFVQGPGIFTEDLSMPLISCALQEKDCWVHCMWMMLNWKKALFPVHIICCRRDLAARRLMDGELQTIQLLQKVPYRVCRPIVCRIDLKAM